MRKEANRKKIMHGQGGFTLVEMLAALLIMVLIALITAGGIPLVLNAYNAVVGESDAQLLLSTTMTELRNELASASEISISTDGKSVEYRSSATGAVSCISLDGSKQQIQLTRYLGYDTASGGSTRPLVSEKAATKNLKAVYEAIGMTDGVIRVSGLQVLGKDGEERCSVEDFYIRNLASS